MLLDLYVGLAGEELVNTARLAAHIANGVKPGTAVITVESCPGLPDVLACIGDGGVLAPPVYTTPDDPEEPAPWYDPLDPASADFAGLLVTAVEGAEVAPFSRPVVPLVGDGASLGEPSFGPREMVVTALLLGRTCCSLQAGLRWLSNVLQTACAPGGAEMEYLECCPEVGLDTSGTGGYEATYTATYPGPANHASYFRTMRQVGVSAGITVTDRVGPSCGRCQSGCTYMEVQFTLTAGDPFSYGPRTEILTSAIDGGYEECVVWDPSPECTGDASDSFAVGQVVNLMGMALEGGAVWLAWDEVPNAEDYVVTYSIAGVNEVYTQGSPHRAISLGLYPGLWTFRVQARRSGVAGPMSAPVTVQALLSPSGSGGSSGGGPGGGTGTLPAPTGLQATSPAPGKILATWQALTGAKDYVVYYELVGTTDKRQVIAGAEGIELGVVGGTWLVSVAARDDTQAVGTTSAQVTVTVTGVASLAQVTGLTVTDLSGAEYGQAYIQSQWNPVVGAEFYVVNYYELSTGKIYVHADVATTIRQAKLWPGAWEVGVRAKAGQDHGLESSRVAITLADAPTDLVAPTNVQLSLGTPDALGGKVHVTWNPVPYAMGYDIFYFQAGDQFSKVEPVGSNIGTLSGLQPGTWWVAVRARAGATLGPLSSPAVGIVVPNPDGSGGTLAAPTGVVATWDPAQGFGGGFVVSWNAVAGAERYEINTGRFGIFDNVWHVTSSPFIFTNSVSASGSYIFRVRAEATGKIDGPFSATVTGTRP